MNPCLALRLSCHRLAVASMLAGAATTLPAQVSGALGVESQVRYRGESTADRGPAVHASVMVDAPWPVVEGLYGGVSGEWRTRDAGLADAQALAGWSGRFNAWPLLYGADPGWGWDSGVRRQHYTDDVRGDFTEAMLGLLAPAGALRVWWAPHYLGFRLSSFYLDLEAHQRLGERWMLFGHLGATLYAPVAPGRARVRSRADGLAGLGYVDGDWDWRVMREGRLRGPSKDAAWIGSANVAF